MDISRWVLIEGFSKLYVTLISRGCCMGIGLGRVRLSFKELF